MTDRELLELAAKAARYTFPWGEIVTGRGSVMARSVEGFKHVDDKGYFTNRL